MPDHRVSIFAEDEIDLSGFAPGAAPAKPAPPAELVRRVSEAAHFHSRQPAAPAPAPSPRMHRPRTYRTGRTATFSAKTTPVVHDAFYAIADRQGWKIGETLEHALAALEKELSAQG